MTPFHDHPLQMDEAEFVMVQKLAGQLFGIKITAEKKALVLGRLQGVLRERGLTTVRAYLERILRDPTHRELGTFIDRLTTNHTFFFRENAHFVFWCETALPEILASLGANRESDLRVWCAAASSGEEPYSIVMSMREALGDRYATLQAGLLATDISERMLARARAGIYDDEDVALVPPTYRMKYLEHFEHGRYRVCDVLRRETLFRRLNLMRETLPFSKPFHAIWCRNAMIYFDAETRSRLLERLHASLVPGGFLFIGHSESLGEGGGRGWRVRQAAVYQKISGEPKMEVGKRWR